MKEWRIVEMENGEFTVETRHRDFFGLLFGQWSWYNVYDFGGNFSTIEEARADVAKRKRWADGLIRKKVLA